MGARIDMIAPGTGEVHGEVGQRILTNQFRLDPGAMRPFVHSNGRTYIQCYNGFGDPTKAESYIVQEVRTYGTLRRDEWKLLDTAVLKVARTRLKGVQHLKDRGLTYSLANPMGTTVLETHRMSEGMAAELTMDAVTRSQADRIVFDTQYLPIPIVHSDYEINTRVLEASRAKGNALDVDMAEEAARKVAEQLENMLFTNTSYTFGGGTISSYINFSARNTVTLSVNWDNGSKTAAQIVDEVRSMKQASINARHYGPWVLYIPTAYETVMDDDYVANAPQNTIRDRILKIDGIEDVVVIDTLPANNVLLVQMDTNVVRLIDGMDIKNVQWSEEGGMITKFKVMAIQVPQIRADKNSRTGLVHLAA